MGRPGRWEAKSFSTDNFCPPSVASCVPPGSLQSMNPADVPDTLHQFSGSIGGPVVEDRTFYFLTDDYTRQDRTSFLSPDLPSFVLPVDGDLAYVGHYRQELLNARVDHKIAPLQTLMFRFNVDRFHDTNPQDTVGGNSAPTVARQYSRAGISRPPKAVP